MAKIKVFGKVYDEVQSGRTYRLEREVEALRTLMESLAKRLQNLEEKLLSPLER